MGPVSFQILSRNYIFYNNNRYVHEQNPADVWFDVTPVETVR